MSTLLNDLMFDVPDVIGANAHVIYQVGNGAGKAQRPG